jgi:tetratricopeptide (TPR) repeat protein
MSYLYLIIPPIVIIISLSLLLFLISRKSQKIIAEKEKNENAVIENGSGISFLSKNKEKLNNFFLLVSEKAAYNFKILSLKSHNFLDKWIKKIREKKEKTKNGYSVKSVYSNKFDQKKTISENVNAGTENRKIPVEKIPVQSGGIRKQNPMVSRDVVYPEALKVERKDELEEILIERIASDPRDIEAYERLGDYYYDRKNSRDAIDCYRQVMKLSPINRAVKVKLKRAERGLRSF